MEEVTLVVIAYDWKEDPGETPQGLFSILTQFNTFEDCNIEISGDTTRDRKVGHKKNQCKGSSGYHINEMKFKSTK